MSEPCIREEKINRLEKDIDGVNERLNRHSEKIDKISDNNLVLETILKRLEEDSTEQKKTNSETQKAMMSVQTAMTEITFSLKGMNDKLAETDENLNKTINKVNEIDDRGKVDIWAYFKSKILPWLFGAGALGGLYALIQSLIK